MVLTLEWILEEGRLKNSLLYHAIVQKQFLWIFVTILSSIVETLKFTLVAKGGRLEVDGLLERKSVLKDMNVKHKKTFSPNSIFSFRESDTSGLTETYEKSEWHQKCWRKKQERERVRERERERERERFCVSVSWKNAKGWQQFENISTVICFCKFPWSLWSFVEVWGPLLYVVILFSVVQSYSHLGRFRKRVPPQLSKRRQHLQLSKNSGLNSQLD